MAIDISILDPVRFIQVMLRTLVTNLLLTLWVPTLAEAALD